MCQNYNYNDELLRKETSRGQFIEDPHDPNYMKSNILKNRRSSTDLKKINRKKRDYQHCTSASFTVHLKF